MFSLEIFFIRKRWVYLANLQIFNIQKNIGTTRYSTAQTPTKSACNNPCRHYISAIQIFRVFQNYTLSSTSEDAKTTLITLAEQSRRTSVETTPRTAESPLRIRSISRGKDTLRDTENQYEISRRTNCTASGCTS